LVVFGLKGWSKCDFFFFFASREKRSWGDGDEGERWRALFVPRDEEEREREWEKQPSSPSKLWRTWFDQSGYVFLVSCIFCGTCCVL